MHDVVNNAVRHQFEVREGERTARLSYRVADGVIDLIHTEVPKELEGHGIAAELTTAALAYAGANGLLVKPTCPYVRSYLKKHPDVGAKLTGRTDD